MEPIKVVGTSSTYVKKFRVYGTRVTFKFNTVPRGTNEIDWLKAGFDSIADKLKSGASDTDQIGLTLRSLNFKNDQTGYIAFRPAYELNSNVIWNIIGGIIQSNNSSLLPQIILKLLVLEWAFMLGPELFYLRTRIKINVPVWVQLQIDQDLIIIF